MQIVRIYYPTRQAIRNREVMGFETHGRTIDRIKSPSLFAKVAQYEIEDGDESMDGQVCEHLFHVTNVPRDWSKPHLPAILEAIKQAAQPFEDDTKSSHCSMSVGDVVEISGRFYVCAAFGFDRITK